MILNNLQSQPLLIKLRNGLSICLIRLICLICLISAPPRQMPSLIFTFDGRRLQHEGSYAR